MYSHAYHDMFHANIFSASCERYTFMPLADYLAQVLTASSAQVIYDVPLHKLVSTILLKHIAMRATTRMMLHNSRKYNEAF